MVAELCEPLCALRGHLQIIDLLEDQVELSAILVHREIVQLLRLANSHVCGRQWPNPAERVILMAPYGRYRRVGINRRWSRTTRAQNPR